MPHSTNPCCPMAYVIVCDGRRISHSLQSNPRPPQSRCPMIDHCGTGRANEPKHIFSKTTIGFSVIIAHDKPIYEVDLVLLHTLHLLPVPEPAVPCLARQRRIITMLGGIGIFEHSLQFTLVHVPNDGLFETLVLINSESN